MDKLRVGIAGYGIVGKRRREIIDRHEQLQTVAVCDQKFEQNGQLPDGVLCFSNYQELVRQPLDILFVSLPNYLAADVCIAALERGLHVFCEKPPGRDVADIKRVIETEQRHQGLLLKYGFNHRYHESVREALRIVRSEELGEVVNLRGVYGKSQLIPFSGGWRAERRYSGGGILLDQGIHMVDLIRLFGGEFREVKSFISNSYWRHDVEDNAYALMRSEEGVIAMLHSSSTQWRHRFNLEVTMRRGTVVLAGILSGTKSYGSETITTAFASDDGQGDPREVTIRYNQDNSWRDEIYEFAECILLRRPVKEGSSAEALKTIQLVYQIYCADSDWAAEHGLSGE